MRCTEGTESEVAVSWFLLGRVHSIPTAIIVAVRVWIDPFDSMVSRRPRWLRAQAKRKTREDWSLKLIVRSV